MGYSERDSMVRVDFFLDWGKWYTTEAIDMEGLWNERDLYDAVRKAIRKSVGTRLEGMTAVCIEPYHKNAFPVMLRNWSKEKG